MSIFAEADVQLLIDLALREDIGSGDVTSLATIPAESNLSAVFSAREALVVCGLDLLSIIYARLDSNVRLTTTLKDGHRCAKGEVIARVEGPARAVLTGERVALNFLQRLSGVATLTRTHVDAIAGTTAQVLDTRKTTPGWRSLEKYAVVCGGGRNHRHGLFDMVLIKDNHLAALLHEKPNAIAAAVNRARAFYPKLKVEVEVDTLEQVKQAAEAGADIILLDNMPPAQLREALRIVNGRAKTEASGGVNLSTIRAIAETGVDYISVGFITHSARAVDIGLDYLE
jgi:nicotinate-nucleotide pyrophosphorylase (carboxylating)